MAEKSGGGGNGEVKVGDVVLYQPTKRDWLQGTSGKELVQLPAIVESVDEEGAEAILICFPTSATMDKVRSSKGDGDGEFMPVGEQSKRAKKLEEEKKAKEEEAKQQAEKAEKESKKAAEDAQKAAEQKPPIPTQQMMIDADQRRMIAQYRYPQPTPESK